MVAFSSSNPAISTTCLRRRSNAGSERSNASCRFSISRSNRFASSSSLSSSEGRPAIKKFLAECFTESAVGGLGILAEELQVLAVIENVEKLFVLIGGEKVRAKTSAAANHLPELRFGTDKFKKDQVNDFRNVDAG